MCSFNACKYNKACREFYERIVAKGKSKKTGSDCGMQQALKTGICHCKIRTRL